MGSNTSTPSPSEHLGEQLVDYLLGALDAAEELAVEVHLLHCEQCRATCDGMATVGIMVNTLPQASIEAEDAPALREPTDQRMVAPNGAALNGAALNGAGPNGVPLSGAGPNGVAPARPVTRLPSPRLGGGRPLEDPRGKSLLRQGFPLLALLLLGVLIGGGGMMLANPDRAVQPVRSDTADAAPGQLIVSVAPGPDGGVDVQANVVGLQPGVPFELVAVADDGHNYVVAQGTAARASQTVTGVVPVPAVRIRFFAVTQPDGALLLVAHPVVMPPGSRRH